MWKYNVYADDVIQFHQPLVVRCLRWCVRINIIAVYVCKATANRCVHCIGQLAMLWNCELVTVDDVISIHFHCPPSRSKGKSIIWPGVNSINIIETLCGFFFCFVLFCFVCFFFLFERTKHQPRCNLRSYLVLQRLCNEAALSPDIDAFWY